MAETAHSDGAPADKGAASWETLPGERKGETEVGSYFISNYPPYSQWGTGEVSHAEEVISKVPGKDTPLGLYLHIPFCRKRCKFCYFRVYTDKSAKEVEVYVDALTREMALYKDQAVFSNRPLRFVYFGGGTPSYLGSRQLKSLVDRLEESVTWADAEEVTFECEPGTLSEPKVAALKDVGVTRLSLGVENFNADVLEENGRAHRSDEIFRAYEWIQGAGFSQVNIDLIAGMVGETDSNWKDCIEKTLELSPDSVTIYQMELPYNTVYSQSILSDGQTSPVADWEQKRAWVKYAFEQLEQNGYEVSSGYTMVKSSNNKNFSYRDSLWHGSDMVGTGVASISHVGGVHYQNLDRLEDYVEAIDQGRLPINRAYPLKPKELLIRELILQLKLGVIDAGYFRNKFGVEILEEFSPAFKRWSEEGFMSWDGDRIEVSREGIIRIDGLLPEFFLPEHQGKRYT